MTGGAPSSNTEAERSVLGALLVSAAAAEQVIDGGLVLAADFYLDRHRVIFACARALRAGGEALDEIVVADALGRREELESAGGRDYIAELAATVPAAGNAKHYAEIVRRCAVERAKRSVGAELLNGLPPAEAVTRLVALEQRRAAGGGDGIRHSPFASVEREEVRWLWPGRVPLGMLTLLIGDPGVGKSLLTATLAALVSRAGRDVLLLNAEDHRGAVLRPRLESAGADLDRVHHIEVRRDGVEDGIALPDDGEALRRIAEETGARLVVVDPLAAHLPESVNSWRDQSVRRALAPLARIAEERRCAVVVVAHLNKSVGTDPIYRTGGSIGIPAAVRSALLLAKDPEDPEGEIGAQRVLAHVKSNVAPLVESLSCEIVAAADQAPTLKVVGTTGTTASDLLGAPAGEARTERDEAMDFLREELASGPQPVKEVQAGARSAGVSTRTLERAKAALGVKAQRESTGQGGPGRWLWALPQDRQPQDRQPYISPEAALSDSALASEDQGGAGAQDRHRNEMAVLQDGTAEDEAEAARLAGKFGVEL
jgi:AAA domain-containing protein/DnaB helicase-like protein